MCDTILATPESTAERVMLFGKNSDRQRNEAQAVEYFAAATHAADAVVDCTYLSIPQARRTHAMLLCRPFWIWGAEMGANECGVVIGNEGLHARSPAPEQDALTGMDLLRLALERASTAAEAVDVITQLLERHGQGGNCGHLTPAFYNNGFAIADGNEAFVLETVNRDWLVERVCDIRAISNRYSIGRNVHANSIGLPALVRDSGWTSEAEPDYASAIANPHREHIGNAGARLACSTSLLRSRAGRLSVADMMSVLRDHGSGESFHPEWRNECTIQRTLCMHAGADDRAGQTVGSMISEIHGKEAVHWVTATAAPCLSIFKPVILSAPLPAHGPRPVDRFDPSTLWWRHERLHRKALGDDFGKFLQTVRNERDALEAEFRSRVKAVFDTSEHAERARVIAQCWSDAIELERRWHADHRFVRPAAHTPQEASWEIMNRIAAVDLS